MQPSDRFLTAMVYSRTRSRLPALNRRALHKPSSSVTNGEQEALEKMSPVIIPSGKVRHWLTPVFWIAVCSSSKESLCPTLPKALVSTVCSRSPTLRTASIRSFGTFSTGTVVWWRKKVKLLPVHCFPLLDSLNSSDCWLIDPCTTLTGDESICILRLRDCCGLTVWLNWSASLYCLRQTGGPCAL